MSFHRGPQRWKLCIHSSKPFVVQIAAVLATFLPLWESREVLIRILVQALTCNKASPESMQKFGSFMGKPGVPRVRVSPSAPTLAPSAAWSAIGRTCPTL